MAGRENKHATGRTWSFPDLIEIARSASDFPSIVDAIAGLSALTGRTYTSVNIVGGGCQDMYLNQMTANATRLPVYAGPVEGTATWLGKLYACGAVGEMVADLERAGKRHAVIAGVVEGGGTIEKVWEMAKYVVAFEQWVKDENIAFIASHYDGFAQGKAGVLDSMLIPAFSMLIKQGVACAVEGDIKVAMAMSILKTISGMGQLSEMYFIDFKEDICIIGHSGSGDADISAKKPTMKIVPVFHGKTGGGQRTA